MNLLENFYSDWRMRAGCAQSLREGASAPPEKFLQVVWQHQRILRGALFTTDGRALRVLHPGFRNFEAGPDFRGAVVQFGDGPPRTGDVEIDLQLGGWRAHGHDVNANFKNVILHVVWNAENGAHKQSLPTLALNKVLDAPLTELAAWLGGEHAESLPEFFRGRCCAPLHELNSESLLALLQQAALVRLRGKAAWFAARARHEGWEQSLWEGLFRALGYKQNVWPMLRLAELRGALGAGKKLSPLEWQARLLGAGGLLPGELTRTQSSTDDFLKRAWNLWWRERDEFEAVTLSPVVWKFNGLRPANHPTRRLALAAHWLARGDLVAQLERWAIVKTEVAAAHWAKRDTATFHSLLELLQADRDEFWSWHWTLKSARMKKSQPLLGATRVTDLGINVILPWLWARATEGRNEKFLRALDKIYFEWPATEDNATLKLARQRLLSGAGRGVFVTAAAQQGLLQIVRDFCEHSNAVCEACRFPDLVRAWDAAH